MAIAPKLTAAQKAKLEAAAALKSGQCRCGHAKQTGMAFCFKCWFLLPRNVRHALYRPVGAGFEAAFDVACQYLTFNQKEDQSGKRKA
jgi:hypothetical protein